MIFLSSPQGCQPQTSISFHIIKVLSSLFFLSYVVNMEEATLFLISQITDISFEERLFKLTDADLLENFPTPEGNFCSPCFMLSCWDRYWVIDQPFSPASTRPFLNPPPLSGISIWITKHIVVFLLFYFFGSTLLTVILGMSKLQTKRYLGSRVAMVGVKGRTTESTCLNHLFELSFTCNKNDILIFIGSIII